MMHKGRIVSRKAHAAGKKAIKRLFSLGYKPTKGKFVAMRKSMVDGRKRRKTKKRGGNNNSESEGENEREGESEDYLESNMM